MSRKTFCTVRVIFIITLVFLVLLIGLILFRSLGLYSTVKTNLRKVGTFNINKYSYKLIDPLKSLQIMRSFWISYNE